MKLLNIKDTKNNKNEEEAQKIKSLSILDKTIASKTREINDLRENKNKRIDKINSDTEKAEINFREYKLEIKKESDGLLREIKDLEKRKEKALEPIEIRQKEVETMQENAKLEIERLDRITLELKDLDEKITQGYEDLQDRKDELDVREEWIISKEESIKKQLEFSDKSIKDLNQKWVELREYELFAKNEIKESKEEVETIRKQNEIMKDELDKRQIEIDNDRKHLQSQQVSLKLAFDKARKNNIHDYQKR